MTDKIRIDRYLWAIRIFKTRSQATSAIDDGKVKLADAAVKPSRPAKIGDRYRIRGESRLWDIEIVSLIENRVGYPEAILCYHDHTPEEDRVPKEKITTTFYTGKRLSKTGKPTKKERRDRDELLG
jgi:ribosome-associated heat shock protein Hsp15